MRSSPAVSPTSPDASHAACTPPPAAPSKGWSVADAMSSRPLRRPDDSVAGRAVPDRGQIERLNTLWAIIDAPVGGGGLRARLAGGVRRLLGRVLARQQ